MERTAAAMSNVETINQLAKDIAERFGGDINAADANARNEFIRLYSAISAEVVKMDKNDMYRDIMADTFYAVMKRYDPQHPFWNYYVRALNNSVKDEMRRKNKEQTTQSRLDEPAGGDTEGITRGDQLYDESDQTERVVHDTGYEVFYLALVDYSLGTKALYSKRKTFNYTPVFFTDQVAFEIIYYGDDRIMGLIRKNGIKFNEASDIAFLNTFVNKHCAGLIDADGAEYLPLSLFTGKEKDAGKPCREKGKLPYPVILKYVEAVSGKSISEPALNQQKIKYDEARINVAKHSLV